MSHAPAPNRAIWAAAAHDFGAGALREDLEVVAEVRQQEVFAETLDRRAGVAGSQLSTISFFVFTVQDFCDSMQECH